MPTVVIPLCDIPIDPDRPVDLTALPVDEAIARIKDLYGFLRAALDVTIVDGVATITLADEQAHHVRTALDTFSRAAKTAARGRYDAAIALYEATLAVLPAHTDARRDLALALMETNQPKKAKPHLIRVLQLDPNDASAYLLLGNLYFRHEHDLGSAERYYISAVDLAPDDAHVISALAALKAARGHLDQAADLFRRAMALDPTMPNPRYGLAAVHLEQGRFDQTIALLEDLFPRPSSTDPRTAVIYQDARRIYLDARGQRSAATADKAEQDLLDAFDAYTQQYGYAIQVEEDATLTTPTHVELGWNHGRRHHVIRVAPEVPATRPYLLAHEFEHILLAEEAREAGRNKTFATPAPQQRTALHSIAKDARRLRGLRGQDPELVHHYLQALVKDVCHQLYRVTLDLVVEARIHAKYPSLRDGQFAFMVVEQTHNTLLITDPELLDAMPPRVHQASATLNGVSVLQLDALYPSMTDLPDLYRKSGHLGVAQRLYAILEKVWAQFAPGDENDLVDAFARHLKLADWYIWKADTPTHDTAD